MVYSDNSDQPSLFNFNNILSVKIPENNELIKLNKEIAWEEMIEIIGRKYSSLKGRNSKSLRMMIGLEIAKRKLGLSDEGIISMLHTDIALKVFCGFNYWHHDIPEASTLCKFRKRLDKETLNLLEEVNLKRFIRKVPFKKKHQVITDSTCIPSNVTFPTDTKLLGKVFDKLVDAAEMIRENGNDLLIRGKRKIKKMLRSFNLKRQKSQKEIVKMKKQLIRAGKKLFEKVESKSKSLVENQLKSKVDKIIQTSKKILAQQQRMIDEKVPRVKDRIVSFHEDSVRPIFRGKDNNKVEFGKKIVVNVIGGSLLQRVITDNNNFSDTGMAQLSLEKHLETFSRYPHELIGDKGCHSPKAHKILEELQIVDGIQYRGKIPQKAKLPPVSAQKRMAKQRVVVEGKIGTLKSAYGCDKNQYKEDNADVWITFGMIAMNGTWAAAH